MQPRFGTDLRRVIFEQVSDESILRIQDIILDAFQIWLPFVEVNDIKVISDNTDTDSNKIIVDIIFNIKKNPNTTDSVTLAFSGDVGSGDETIIDNSGVGGTY